MITKHLFEIGRKGAKNKEVYIKLSMSLNTKKSPERVIFSDNFYC